MNFPKILEQPQNSRCQKGDIKQVSHSGPAPNLVAWATWFTGFVRPNSLFYLLQEFFLKYFMRKIHKSTIILFFPQII
jgi:hypothetical protein